MQQTSFDSKTIFDYIFGLTYPGVKLELSRVYQFMDYLGLPHADYPVIHIAGTNGKGSTAAMLAAILNAYGINTGVFTSPHLVRPNERIRIGEKMIPDAFIIEKVESWRSEIDKLGITFFEVLTALGMVYFKEQGVDYAVFETGLGGRLDATNVVDPVVSLITAISMDHENILGHTIELIAAEKAGIIKTGKPLVLGKNSLKIQNIMATESEAKNTEYHYVPEKARIEQADVNGLSQQVRIGLKEQVIHAKLPLLGLHQVENFSNVLVTLELLGLKLDQEKIQSGLDGMQWLGRIQPLQQQPLVLYDVAHNQEGLERLLESLNGAGLPDTILIAAFNARKNIAALLHSLGSWGSPVLYTLFEGHSALGRKELLEQSIDPELIIADPEAAYTHALGLRTHDQQAICFFGTHYLAETLFAL
ncbi:MAG: hypothetical protein L3J79_11220, partial [Candidatus Marinimicrobia bacterium]|nr:hypothetical protein [Candidatus Neomarinimicrobiota bacterium]